MPGDLRSHVVHHAQDAKVGLVRGNVVAVADHHVPVGHVDGEAALVQILVAQPRGVQNLKGPHQVQRGGHADEPAPPGKGGFAAVAFSVAAHDDL